MRLIRKIGGLGPAIIFLVALAYRLLYLWTVRDDPLMTRVDFVPDASIYHAWALNIINGVKTTGVYYIGPAYGYFLALVYKTFGVHLYAAIITQLVLGALSAAFVYALSRRLFGRGAAAVAGLLWAFYLPAAFFDTQILPASLTIFFVTLSLWLLTVALAGGRRWAAAALGAGAAFGLATLARPNLLLFIPALALWPASRRKAPWRTLILFAAPVILAVAVATVRNKVVADDWVIVSSQGGINFFIGNNDAATGAFMPPPGTFPRPEDMNDTQMRAAAEAALGRPLEASAASRWWLARGLRYVAANAGDAALLYGRKVSLLTNNYEVTLNNDFNIRREFSAFHRLGVPYFGIVFTLGLLGLAMSFRERSPARTMLLIYLAATAVSVLLFFVVDWYRLPLAPVLAVAAGFGATRLADDARRRRWLAAVLGGGAAALLLVFSWLPGVGADRAGVASQSYFNYGTYYLFQGDLGRAGDYFRTSLRYKPDNTWSLSYLGLVWERQGREGVARSYYARAYDLNPYDPETNYLLAMSYARAGDWPKAIPLLEAAVATSPGYADAWRALAECYGRRGDYPASLRAYARLAALVPDDAEVRLRYAEGLMASGRYDEGVAAARRALALQPNVVGAHLLLGRYYLMRGELTAAARELRAEVALAPDRPAAYALLAEYYYQRGDAGAARAQYERYLALGGAPIERFEIGR